MIINDAYTNKSYYGGTSYQPMINLLYGGSEGHTAHISRMMDDGQVFEEYMSMDPYISNNVIPIVLRTPGIFDALADVELGSRLKQHYINMMTIMPKTIDGLKRTVNVSFAEERLGGTGEVLESVTNVTKEKSDIQHTYIDRVGKPVWTLHDFLIRYAKMDYETGMPLAVTLDLKPGYLEKGQEPDRAFYTGTMAYVEPNITRKNVVEAYISGNIFPRTTGANESNSDRGSDRKRSELSIGYTNVTISGEPAKVVGQIILDKMQVFKENPDRLSALMNDNDVQKSVEAALGFDEIVK